MSREVRADFEKLEDFFKEVSLADHFSNRKFVEHLKTMHKKAYAILLYTCERDFQKSQELDEHAIDYVNETLSDLLQVTYCWCNGLYKTSQLQLRSAIEMFVKGIAGNENEKVFEEKNVYRVFELAKDTSWFSSALGAQYLINLHQVYAELCAAVHGAKQINLELISALGSIPNYDDRKASELVAQFCRTLDYIIGIILLNSHVINNMHHVNRQSFLDALPRTMKSEIYLVTPEKC